MECNSIVLSETSFISQEVYQNMLNRVKYDKVKSIVTKEFEKTQFDVDQAVARFLNSAKSDRTRKIYSSILAKFQQEGVHFFDVTAEKADDIVASLKLKYASATVRLYVACLSGFYSNLVRWGYINSNPFTGTNLPKRERSKELIVPDIATIGKILAYYKNIFNYETNNARKRMAAKMIVSVELMSKLGLRVGALKDLQVRNGVYRTRSKGKVIKGEFTLNPALFGYYGFDLDKEFPFQELNKAAIQRNLSLLKNEGIDVHAHGFRHFFAVELYKETKDVYAICKALNHNSVSITEKYLESIDIDVNLW